MSPPASDVVSLLRAIRRRLGAQMLLDRLCAAGLSAGLLLVLLFVAERWAHLPLGNRRAVAVLVLVPLSLALVQTWLFLPTLPKLAALLDRLGRTHDRLATALALPSSAMGGLAQRECAAYLGSRNFRELLPWRLPLASRWLLVPVVALGLLIWEARLADQSRSALLAQAQTEAAPTVERLRALAGKLAEKADRNHDVELQKLAAEVARRAEALRAAATDPGQAGKAALREISALEQLAREMQRPPPGNLSPEELKALTAALEKAEATRGAAEKLQAGERAAAAQELERVAADQAAAPAAEEALRQALQQLADQQQLSEASQQQLASATGAAESSALRKLAEMLRQMPATSGGAQPGRSAPSPQDLQSLLAALENLKAGMKPAGATQPGGPQALPPAGIAVSPPSASGGENILAQLPIPAANPGGERDTGTTESPFGANQPPTPKGADLALQGQQGEQGATLSQALPAGAEASRASRQYRQLYQSLAPAMENAVLQEEIPLGSRLYIKRYFESIRPPQ